MISDRNLYLTRTGRVVEENHPESHELLVGRGCYLPDARARALGLLPADPQPEVTVPQPRVDELTRTFAERAREAVLPDLAALVARVAALEACLFGNPDGEPEAEPEPESEPEGQPEPAPQPEAAPAKKGRK